MPRQKLALPIRLVPLRRVVAGHAFFCLLFLGLGLWGLHLRFAQFPAAETGQFVGLLALDAPLALTTAGTGLAAVGLFACLLKLLPGSPFQHVGIHQGGLRLRGLLGSQHFTWAELSAFAPRDRASDERWGGDHSVIAFRAHETELAEEGQMEPEVALRIDAGRFGHDWGRDNGGALASWLNELRELHALGQLGPRQALIIPDAFRRSAVAERPPRSTQPAATPDLPDSTHEPRALKPSRPQTVARR